jgi:hypothetical protein
MDAKVFFVYNIYQSMCLPNNITEDLRVEKNSS